MNRWIRVHSKTSGRKILVRTDQIDLVVEKNTAGHYNTNGVWVGEYRGSEIVLRSGERGECQESPSLVLQLIQGRA